MANPIASIVIAAVDKTKAVFASVKSGLSDIGKSIGTVQSLFASLGVGLSLAGLIGQLKGTIDKMDEAGKSAQKIGTSVENFTALSYAAGLADVPVEALEKSLARLASRIDDAKSGAGPAAEAFARLKIDPKQFTDPADALLVIAERFAAMPDGVNKTALAIALFGKEGAAMIPLLNEGRAGIEAMKKEAADLGIVLHGDASDAANEFNDNLTKLSASFSDLKIAVVSNALPGLNEITRVMADAAKKGGITAAMIAGLKSQVVDFLQNDQLSATYKLIQAQQQLNDLRADGFSEDQHRVVELKKAIPELQRLANEEKKVEEDRKKTSKATSDDIGANYKDEAEAFKKSTNEQISDAQRLQGALQSAFEASTKAEEDYLRQAKKLRDEANGTTPVKGDVQSQASANLDAITKAMQLQREAGSASLQSVQDQSAALQQLAQQLDDQALKSDIIKQAKLAEATALDKAAADEKVRYTQLGQIQDEQARKTQNMKDALAGIGKEVSVDIKPGTGIQQVKKDLTDIKGLLDAIGNRQLMIPVNTSGTAAMAAALKAEALKYGNRQ